MWFLWFDSFDGFGKINENDKHQRFNDNIFSVDEKILSNIKKSSKGQKYKIIKGFFEDTLKNDPKKYEIKNARVVMIDCDLKESTTLALNFLTSVLQKAQSYFSMTIFFIKAMKKGEFAAFKEFKEKT